MIRIFWCAVLFAVSSQSGFARLRALFSPQAASWSASNIVLVETTFIDGSFQVIESWKGDLPTVSKIRVPDLIPKVTALPISAYPNLQIPFSRSHTAEEIPRQPVGSRMVLFLRRSQSKSSEVQQSECLGWSVGDDEDSMKIASVWIDAGGTYTFTQLWMTSGPLALAEYKGEVQGEQRFAPRSEKWLKDEVERVLSVQNEMAIILEQKDGRARVLLLKPFVLSRMFRARQQAIEALGKSGPSAVGIIGDMLDDPAFAEQASELVDAMVVAGEKTAGEELNRRFERDVAFWERTAPTLRQGWWNEDITPTSPLRNRYVQTYQLVAGLKQIHYTGALYAAIELGDLWRSVRQDNDEGGLNEMSQACDALIAELQIN